MATENIPTSPLTGEVMFYKQPEPLNKEAHKKLGLNPSTTPFAFAKDAHAVPLIVGEFGPVSLNFPIIFAGAEYQPLAIMSIRAGGNLFIGDDGQYAAGVYIPAFIRRYPFVMANAPEEGQMIVCIDRGADIIAENGDTPLFENGEPSEFTKKCMEFCTNFEVERRKTDDFLKTLKDLDLFVPREITFTPTEEDGSPGTPIKISDHYSPSEEKVKELPDKTKLELMNSGALQQIHAHWNSMLLWERLVQETLRRYPPEPEPAAANA